MSFHAICHVTLERTGFTFWFTSTSIRAKGYILVLQMRDKKAKKKEKFWIRRKKSLLDFPKKIAPSKTPSIKKKENQKENENLQAVFILVTGKFFKHPSERIGEGKFISEEGDSGHSIIDLLLLDISRREKAIKKSVKGERYYLFIWLRFLKAALVPKNWFWFLVKDLKEDLKKVGKEWEEREKEVLSKALETLFEEWSEHHEPNYYKF